MPKRKKDKQRSTKHTHKTKERVTRTSLKTGGEHRCSGCVGSSCIIMYLKIKELNVKNQIISNLLEQDNQRA